MGQDGPDNTYPSEARIRLGEIFTASKLDEDAQTMSRRKRFSAAASALERTLEDER